MNREKFDQLVKKIREENPTPFYTVINLRTQNEFKPNHTNLGMVKTTYVSVDVNTGKETIYPGTESLRTNNIHVSAVQAAIRENKVFRGCHWSRLKD